MNTVQASGARVRGNATMRHQSESPWIGGDPGSHTRVIVPRNSQWLMLIMEILIWTGVLGFRGLWQKVQGQGDCFLCLNFIIDNNTVACKCTFLNSLAKQQPIKENNSVVDL